MSQPSIPIKQVPAHITNYSQGTSKKIGIVFHWIVGELSSADAKFTKPNQKVSAHFGIGSNGEIHQYVPVENIAWHTGKADANRNYIGIEHAGGQLLKNGSRKKPTQACHDASARLIRWLHNEYNIPVIGYPHSKFVATMCSGSLDYQYILGKAKNKMIEFNRLFNFILSAGKKILLVNGKEITASADIVVSCNAVTDKGFRVIEYTGVDNIRYTVDGIVAFTDINTRSLEALDFQRLVRKMS